MKYLIVILSIAISACGGKDGDSSSISTPDSGVPSNYQEITQTCAQHYASVTYIRMVWAGGWELWFYPSMAQCEAGGNDFNCRIFTSGFGSQTCFGNIHLDLNAPYSTSADENEWVYYE